MSNELKPCPFCGGTDIREDVNLRNGFAEVFCDDCGGMITDEHKSADARDCWNRRAALSGMAEPVIEEVAMVDYSSGFEMPAEPVYRIVANEYCADFPTKSAAENFYRAFAASLATPPASEREEIARLRKALEWLRRNYASGPTTEINRVIDSALNQEGR